MSASLDNRQLLAWVASVPRTDQRSFHAWANAAGVAPNVLYRLRSGEHKTLSAENLGKLASVTSVPLPRVTD